MPGKEELLKSLKIEDAERHGAKDVSRIGLGIAFLVGGIGGAVLTAFLWAERTPAPQSAPQIAVPQPVQDAPATEVTVDAERSVLSAAGYVTARRMATVSAEITGLITEVLIEEGMVVEEGQLLARLDSAVASAGVALARARIDEARGTQAAIVANLAEARRELDRASTLRRENFASEARVTQAEATVAALEADLDRASASIRVAEAELRRLSERLMDHEIRAPFAGVVTVKAAQPGEIVSPESAGGGFTRTGICTIVDMESLEIEVDVNEAYIGRVQGGQRVRAILDAYPDWQIPASVIAIVPTANREKATVRVRIGIDVRDARILPDMGVKVDFLEI